MCHKIVKELSKTSAALRLSPALAQLAFPLDQRRQNFCHTPTFR